jgi:GDP-mannose 6-dehydrogenase
MRVAVFGLGYVGTVTAACLADNGHDVWGVDVDRAKVSMIVSGTSPVIEPGLDDLVSRVVTSGALHATANAEEAIEGSDASLVCVGTPSSSSGAANLSFVERVTSDVARVLRREGVGAAERHTLVVRSTVPPGTVERMGRCLRESLEGSPACASAAMCPEFLREGTGIVDFYSPPYTVVGAEDQMAVDVVRRLFGFVEGPFRVVDIRTAESLKYACNAFHATKISFANEMGRVLRRLGVDSRMVMELFCEDHKLNISDRYLRPGFAFGGSCLPKDLRSLAYIARMESVDLPLLAGVLQSNRLPLADVVERVVAGPGRRVVLLGLSFKSGSDDLRESPYVDLAETLLGKGYEVRIYDPVVNPPALTGANRDDVESKLPHLRKILTESATEAVRDCDVAIVSLSTPEVTDAILLDPPPRIIDLDGRLGEALEALPGYEGVLW